MNRHAFLAGFVGLATLMIACKDETPAATTATATATATPTAMTAPSTVRTKAPRPRADDEPLAIGDGGEISSDAGDAQAPWVGGFLIRPDGKFLYPRDGGFDQIPAAGMRPSELERRINENWHGAAPSKGDLTVSVRRRAVCSYAPDDPACAPRVQSTKARAELAARVVGLPWRDAVEQLSAAGMICASAASPDERCEGTNLGWRIPTANWR